MLNVVARYAKRNNPTLVGLSFLLTLLYVFFAIGQLVTFEKMPGILTVLWPLGAAEYAKIGSALLVVSLVFALPFFLGMQLSMAMRAMSAACGYFFALYIVLIGIFSSAPVELANSGLAGELVIIPVGTWLIWFGFGLLGLLLWYTIRAILDETPRARSSKT